MSIPPEQLLMSDAIGGTGPLECSGATLSIAQPGGTEADDQVGVAAGYVLAFPAIALGHEMRVGRCAKAQVAAEAFPADVVGDRRSWVWWIIIAQQPMKPLGSVSTVCIRPG